MLILHGSSRLHVAAVCQLLSIRLLILYVYVSLTVCTIKMCALGRACSVETVPEILSFHKELRTSRAQFFFGTAPYGRKDALRALALQERMVS